MHTFSFAHTSHMILKYTFRTSDKKIQTVSIVNFLMYFGAHNFQGVDSSYHIQTNLGVERGII